MILSYLQCIQAGSKDPGSQDQAVRGLTLNHWDAPLRRKMHWSFFFLFFFEKPNQWCLLLSNHLRQMKTFLKTHFDSIKLKMKGWFWHWEYYWDVTKRISRLYLDKSLKSTENKDQWKKSLWLNKETKNATILPPFFFYLHHIFT